MRSTDESRNRWGRAAYLSRIATSGPFHRGMYDVAVHQQKDRTTASQTGCYFRKQCLWVLLPFAVAGCRNNKDAFDYVESRSTTARRSLDVHHDTWLAAQASVVLGKSRLEITSNQTPYCALERPDARLGQYQFRRPSRPNPRRHRPVFRRYAYEDR